MGRRHKPRSGSLQVWPRKRAKSENPRIRSWVTLDSTQLAGFVGYKVGMTQISYIDKNPNSRLKKNEAISPATLVECPPLKPYSIRFYRETEYGWKIITEILSKNLDKNLSRRITLPKKQKDQKIPETYDDVRIIAYTQPFLTSLPKKSPELVELGITGPKEKKLEYAQSLLNKEIKVTDIFNQPKMIDVHAVTKGKGLQGSIKRYGIGLKKAKSEKHKRAIGNLGAWHPAKVKYTIAHPGQKGYHHRTDYNNQIVKIGESKDNPNPKEGWRRYGLIKNDYIIVYGSIPGPTKRMVKFTPSIRKKQNMKIELKGVLL